MQHTQHIAMVRPAAFGYNHETAANNYFQQQHSEGNSSLAADVLKEFDDMLLLLQLNGIDVLVLEDQPIPPKPDAIFPNNWFSCSNGLIQIFPLYAPNRRLEKNWAILDVIKQQSGISMVKDWGPYEEKNMFLEGTGSIVIDHSHNIAYACLSARTNEILFRQFCKENNYLPICFTAADENGREIYHTNVMMCIGEQLAIICLEAISDAIDRQKILHELQTTGHTIVDISFSQMNSFAGNMLELINDKDEVLLLMSHRAFKSLLPHQVNTIQQYARILQPDVSNIETIAGGSVRCMMAELFY